MRRGGGTRAQAGLTLVELVVALAVFALIAVLGLQGLTGALRMRDDLTDRAARSAGLIQATARLRNDLAAAVPLLFFPPGTGALQSALQARPDGGFALSLGGVPLLSGLAPEDPGLRRAEWHFDAATGRLTRRLWPTLYPVEPAQAGAEALVLEGLRGLRFRSYWPGKGWEAGLGDGPGGGAPPASDDGDSAGATPEVYSDALPQAVEITLDTEAWGEITVLEFLQ